MPYDPFDIDNLPPREPLKPATEVQIAAFEKRIGSALPADYRDYLRTVNAGAPDPHNYFGERMELYVQYIHSLLDDEEDGLIWEWITSHLPKTFQSVLLPIATANGGDALHLSLVNGEVFFYSHEEDSFTLIEKSFSGILGNLQDRPFE